MTSKLTRRRSYQYNLRRISSSRCELLGKELLAEHSGLQNLAHEHHMTHEQNLTYMSEIIHIHENRIQEPAPGRKSSHGAKIETSETTLKLIQN